MKRLTKYESIAGHAHAIPIVDADIAIKKLAEYEDLEEQGTRSTQAHISRLKGADMQEICLRCIAAVLVIGLFTVGLIYVAIKDIQNHS